jgi:hypothetical protein
MCDREGEAALLLWRCARRTRFIYLPALLAGVGGGMAAYEEEIFGPAATIIEVQDDDGPLPWPTTVITATARPFFHGTLIVPLP